MLDRYIGFLFAHIYIYVYMCVFCLAFWGSRGSPVLSSPDSSSLSNFLFADEGLFLISAFFSAINMAAPGVMISSITSSIEACMVLHVEVDLNIKQLT